MACISPPPLGDSQLLAYIDGEADAAIAEHIEACSDCRERAEAIRQLQNALQARLYRSTCPTPEQLGDYQLNLLSGGQRAQIAQHLQECPHCSMEIAQLRDFLREPDPPFFRPDWGTINVLVARLAGDRGSLGEHQLQTALRGAGEGPLTFEAEGILIVLDLQLAAHGGWEIQGQVAAEDQDHWIGVRVELQPADRMDLETRIDELGAFQLNHVPAGPAELRLLPEGGPVVIVNLTL